jgi:hypothetical protein
MEKKYHCLNQKLHNLSSQHMETHTKNPHFYPRVVNNINITFTTEENKLLQKALKYKHLKPKQWIQTLAIEAETTINLPPIPDQDPLRYQTARNLSRLAHNTNQKTSHNIQAYREKRIFNGIQEKLRHNSAIITKADKGNSIIIIDKIIYDCKILNFLDNNCFQTESKDPTKRFQNEVRKTINSCPLITPSNLKWKYVNMNPSPSTIRGLIKIHKPDAPIRPIINWQHAPA